MSDSLQAEIDVLLDDLKTWEDAMTYEWSEADRCYYLDKKKDTFKNFFLNQVAHWEQVKSNVAAPTTASPTPVSSEDDAIRQQLEKEEQELKAAEEHAKAAAEEAAVEAELRRQLEDEDRKKKLADAARAQEEATRKAAEEAALEAEVLKQLQAEERAAAAAVAQVATPEVKREASSHRVSSPPPVQLTSSSAPSAEDLDELNAALEKEFKEAQLRITRQPIGRQADLTDASVVPTYIRIRNDRDDLNWMMLGYPNADQPNKISVIGCGAGGWPEMVPQVPEEPIFLYFNHKFGDTGRSKFVFMTYVPDSLSGMKKSRVLGHRPAIEKLFKYMQLSWHVLEKSEFQIDTLQSKLLAAGGANYSVQESDKGDFSSYKSKTAEFYTETEKKGNIGPVVYQAGPLSATPMDISGRSMVAPQAEFRNNLVTK